MKRVNQKSTWDTVLYNGESRILIERLDALKTLCNYFVILESLYTFSGKVKQADVTTKSFVTDLYGERVKWVTITDRMPHLSSWEYESWQRQQISKGLGGIENGDLVLLSDVDEIPSLEFISKASELESNSVLIAEMNLRIYDPHFLSDVKWYGTIGVKFQQGGELNFQELRMRAVKHWEEERESIFKSGGNHLSTLGSSSWFRAKIKSFSHTEFDTFPYNTSFFLFMISKLGICLDGSEVLRLDIGPLKGQCIGLCNSQHKLDRLRFALASLMRPIVQFIFKARIRALSMPT